jgi:hypothetical protein
MHRVMQVYARRGATINMKRILSAIAVLMVTASAMAELHYVDAAQFPLIGKATTASTIRYGRLPDSLKNISRGDLWDLGRNSAGLAVRFRTNATIIAAKWDVWLCRFMNHMSPTGIRGLDLYCLQDDGTWTFVNSGRPSIQASSDCVIIRNMDLKEREYMLYLSLYDGETALEIGIDSTATIEAPKVDLPSTKKPIVWYGTSLLQGGCASRPGMGVTNIVMRRLNREVMNLGFSGNAELDPEIAEVMANVDAGLFIIDCLPNCSLEQLNERLEPFYRTIRDKHPDVDVLFIENPRFPYMRFNREIKKQVNAKNAVLRTVFNKLTKQGEKNIFYISSDGMTGNDGDQTIDGEHYTDLGFERLADFMTPIIKQHLK